jgi:hypothetical protein
MVCLMLLNASMIAIIGKETRDGHEELAQVIVPANHSEARGGNVNAWGLVIAGGLLLLATTFICLILFAA